RIAGEADAAEGEGDHDGGRRDRDSRTPAAQVRAGPDSRGQQPPDAPKGHEDELGDGGVAEPVQKRPVEAGRRLEPMVDVSVRMRAPAREGGVDPGGER